MGWRSFIIDTVRQSREAVGAAMGCIMSSYFPLLNRRGTQPSSSPAALSCHITAAALADIRVALTQKSHRPPPTALRPPPCALLPNALPGLVHASYCSSGEGTVLTRSEIGKQFLRELTCHRIKDFGSSSWERHLRFSKMSCAIDAPGRGLQEVDSCLIQPESST